MQKGDNLAKVNEKLKIIPYDVMFYNPESYLVAIYYYKHPWRTISNDDMKLRHTQKLLNSGEIVYGEVSKLYVFFDKEQKLCGFYTDSGNSKGKSQTETHEYLKQIPEKYQFIQSNSSADSTKTKEQHSIVIDNTVPRMM